MRFYTFILRNVLRRPIRTILTMTGMAVAVVAVVSLVGLASGLKDSMLSLYVNRGVSLIVTDAHAVSPLTGTLPAKVASETSNLPGVAATCAGLVEFQTIEECGSDPIGVQGWPAGNHMFGNLKIQPGGEGLSNRPSGSKDVVIGCTLANVKQLKVGQSLTMNDEKLHVVGIFESSEDLENGMVVMLLDTAQKLFGKSDKMTGCTVMVKDTSPEGIEAVRQAIEGPIAEKCGVKGKIRAKSPQDFVKENKQVQMVTGFAWMTSTVALIIGGIGVLNTMFMSVFERTREIGILRAIGWPPRRVMRMILMESVLLSIGGGVVGTAGGLGLIVLLSHFPAVSGIVHAAITPGIVLEGFAIAIFVGVAGAAYPAYRGSRLLPTEALRHE
jgi:putative ABC transport system permease protein